MRSNGALVVLGTGGHAAVVIELARAAGFEIAGCVGPLRPAFEPDYCTYLGDDAVLEELDCARIMVAVGVGSIGDSRVRRDIFEKHDAQGFKFPPLAHPRAVIASTVKLAAGAQVMAGAIVQSFADIGANAIINSGAIVEHHVRIGAHAHVAPGAVVCGGATISEGSHIGANATVLHGLTVGVASVVGIGAVVVKSVEAARTVKGVPAK